MRIVPLLLLLLVVLSSVTLNTYAFQADQERIAKEQKGLDQACEAAREVKLEPLRQEAIADCMKSPRSTDTEADCQRKYALWNANRSGGNPRFYDLPECVKAFDYRKQHPKTN